MRGAVHGRVRPDFGGCGRRPIHVVDPQALPDDTARPTGLSVPTPRKQDLIGGDDDLEQDDALVTGSLQCGRPPSRRIGAPRRDGGWRIAILATSRRISSGRGTAGLCAFVLLRRQRAGDERAAEALPYLGPALGE